MQLRMIRGYKWLADQLDSLPKKVNRAVFDPAKVPVSHDAGQKSLVGPPKP
jgi:hypothetical protein